MTSFRNLLFLLAVLFFGWPIGLSAGWHADYIATLPTQTVRVVDAEGRPVQGVSVGRGLRISEADDGLAGGNTGGTLMQWSWSEDGRTASVTDAEGTARIRVPDQHIADGRKIAVYAWDPYGGGVALAEFGAEDMEADGSVLEVKLQPGCRVNVDLRSPELDAMGTPLFETTAYLKWGDHSILLMQRSTQRRASFFLPPGEYHLRLFGHGLGIPLPESGGVPTEEIQKTLNINTGQSTLDLGTLDLPVTPQGQLFGRPAPPLGPMSFWKNSEPLTLDELRGKVVVLLFWSRHCPSAATIPAYADLIRDRLGTEHLEIIAIHEADEELANQAAFDRLVQPGLDAAAAGYADYDPKDDPGEIGLPIAVEIRLTKEHGIGPTGLAYRQDRWPTGLIIGTDGRLLHQMF
ncbi:MAG: hypothetical protein AAF593_12270, partial [Planctomycetota bacterium]